MRPFTLQGCNLALESCRALDAALQATSCDLDVAPREYSDARVADAHAFQDLEVMQVSALPITWHPTVSYLCFLGAFVKVRSKHATVMAVEPDLVALCCAGVSWLQNEDLCGLRGV